MISVKIQLHWTYKPVNTRNKQSQIFFMQVLTVCWVKKCFSKLKRLIIEMLPAPWLFKNLSFIAQVNTLKNKAFEVYCIKTIFYLFPSIVIHWDVGEHSNSL